MSGFAAPGVLAAASKLAWCRRPRGYRPSGTPAASNRGTAAVRSATTVGVRGGGAVALPLANGVAGKRRDGHRSTILSLRLSRLTINDSVSEMQR